MAPALGILITGGAGFIGSNFVPYFCRKYRNYMVVCLDKLTYAGNMDNLRGCDGLPNFAFIEGDICDRNLLEQIFGCYDIRGVIHFAAESHVDNSIDNPATFVNTNIYGTFNLLETCYHNWMLGPNEVKQGYSWSRFHNVSTDEVYGALGHDGKFTESSAYAPNSPYAATKASSDFLVRSYHQTYGFNVTTSHCSNNFGPKQHFEKLIPKTIERCLHEEQIPVYGTGLNVRDWIFVQDHCEAVDLIFHEGKKGETYNIGGNHEVANILLVREICALLDKIVPRKNNESYSELISFVEDREGHDFRYAIDASKLEKDLGWHPRFSFEQSLEHTVLWYLRKYGVPH